jgi:putative intracellular protease/amidase
MPKQVLMIVTSHSSLGDTGKPTGLYLSELAHPYEVLSKAGFDIRVVSPKGKDAPIDPKSLSEELAPYAKFAKNTLSLKDIKVEDYDAYFVVGGHGVMWDLPDNVELQNILTTAYAQNKVIAAVCHGPAALVQLKNPDGSFTIEGKRVTGFTNDEEEAVGLSQVMPFLLEDGLKNAGGEFVKASKWQANVVVDDRLVTGQNPASAKGVAEVVVKLLAA